MLVYVCSGVILEEAQQRCGGSAGLSAATGRGAVRKTLVNGVEFYHFPVLEAGNDTLTETVEAVEHGKDISASNFEAASRLLEQHGWSLGTGEPILDHTLNLVDGKLSPDGRAHFSKMQGALQKANNGLERVVESSLRLAEHCALTASKVLEAQDALLVTGGLLADLKHLIRWHRVPRVIGVPSTEDLKKFDMCVSKQTRALTSLQASLRPSK